MKDGIDRQAYLTRLRSADAVERKRYAAELGEWMRSAALQTRRQAYWGMAFLAIGVGLVILSFRSADSARFILAIALVMIAGGQWLSWIGNRHARSWRRAHPFEEWRRSQAKGHIRIS